MLLQLRSILVLIVLAFVLVDCKSLQPTAEELNDPSQALHIRLVSSPPGASVYGLVGDSIGVHLGTTPMTCKYVYRKVTGKPVIFGTEVEQTLTCNLTAEDNLGPPYTFHCWLVKDGYKVTQVRQDLHRSEESNPWNFSTADAFSPRVEKITIELEPLEN